MVPSTPIVPSGAQVTGPLKEPVKIAPAAMPAVPLPVMVKVPPGLKTAPLVVSPDASAPVVKDTVPQGKAVEHVPVPRPVTPVRLEPVRVKPAELPERIPPVLLKSTLPAKADNGRAKASRAIHTIRFINYFLLIMLRAQFQCLGGFRPPLAVPRDATAMSIRAPWVPNLMKT